jgi:hypothetical protein
LNPVGDVEKKLGHGFDPDGVGREQDLPDLFPYLGSAGFTGKQEKALVLLKIRGQMADLGGLAASFDSLEGYEKAQFSSTFLLERLYPK